MLLTPTYNAVLSFLPRQLNNQSHLCSPSPSNPHEGWLGQQPTSGPNDSKLHSYKGFKSLQLPSN